MVNNHVIQIIQIISGLKRPRHLHVFKFPNAQYIIQHNISYMDKTDETSWPLVEKYFEGSNSKYRLTQHHLESYGDFIRYKIPNIIHDFNSWQNSQVFRGINYKEDSESQRQLNSSAQLTSNTNINTNARCHFFAGMDPLDLYEATRDGESIMHEKHSPKRVQVRHQFIEFPHQQNAPRRWMTPNEARLRNLNYQLEYSFNLTIIQSSRLTQDENILHAAQYGKLVTDRWYREYKWAFGLFKPLQPELPADAIKTIIKSKTDDCLKRAKTKKHGHVEDMKRCLQSAQKMSLGKYSRYDDVHKYVAQRIATELVEEVIWEEGIPLGMIPLMLHSEFCILRNQSDAFLKQVGECVYERGGYFIIRGKEKVIISQEEYQPNQLQIRTTNNVTEGVLPDTTFIINSKTEAIDEVVEASIRCDDHPRPPVEVKIEYKRNTSYYNSGHNNDDSQSNPFAFKERQLGRMQQFLPFKGFYISIFSRKGKTAPLLVDMPLFIFMRAMGPTSGQRTGNGQANQLSDREMMETILGYDMSGKETAVVPKNSWLPSLNVTKRLPDVGSSTWYFPNGEANRIWCTLTNDKTSFSKDATVTIDLPTSGSGKSSKLVRAVVKKTLKGSGGECHALLELVETCGLSIESSPVQSNVRINKGSYKCILCPCRYARKHWATVLHVSDKEIELSYSTHTRRDRVYDTLLYDVLAPSISESAFAPTVDIARDMLDRMLTSTTHQTLDNLRMQDEILSGTTKSTEKDRREALFRALFTHIKCNTSISNEQSRQNAHHRAKQLYLGHIVKHVCYSYLGIEDRNTSKDSYQIRRVKSSGEMLSEVFRYEYFQLNNKFKEYVQQGMIQQGTSGELTQLCNREVLTTRIYDSNYMTERLQKSFMGNWGSKVAENAEDQKAYCQELVRLSFLGSLSYLRRVHKELPTTSKPGQKKGTSKAVEPRLLHASQYGMICPLETPDGGNIGKIKHLTLFAFICPQMPLDDRQDIQRFLEKYAIPSEAVARFADIVYYHKIIVDGAWLYSVPEAGHRPLLQPEYTNHIKSRQTLPPDMFVNLLRLFRRNGLISPLLSVAWNIREKEIHLRTQEGRPLRPLLIVDSLNHLAITHSQIREISSDKQSDAWSWEELQAGRCPNPSKSDHTRTYHGLTLKYTLKDKVPDADRMSVQELYTELQRLSGVLEYIDVAEINTCMIAMQKQQLIQREWLINTIFKLPELVSALLKDGSLIYTDKDQSQTTARLISTVSLKGWLHNRVKKMNKEVLKRRQHVPTNCLLEFDLAEVSGVPAYEHDASSVHDSPSGGIVMRFTHCEIHPSFMLGIMGSLIPYPEQSAAPRNQYSCHQSKQGLGTYVSNFRKRMDHSNHILHYPQRPLCTSRYMKYFNNNKLNYGTNVIVAIMCYGGYNIEDAILFNKQSVQRGLFQSTYYFTEEVSEQKSTAESTIVGRHPDITRNSTKYDYSKIDTDKKKRSVIPDTFLDKPVSKDDVLIEAYEEKQDNIDNKSYTDNKRVVSKDAIIDQIYLSDDTVGRRVAKVTMRKVRIPTVGDKFASRCGQKGTLGTLIEEDEMPFIGTNSDKQFLQGLRPDLILNPHAIPSRMTIGQLNESISNVLGCKLGSFTDSTPLCSSQTVEDKSTNIENVSAILSALGLNKYGNVRMCNGCTGERLRGEIFIGPTYYQRLKQMPADKYYWRRQGRSDIYTRQPIGGRAQGGALKLGEMERDSLLAHGIMGFTKEAFYEKSDHFQCQVGKRTGDVEPVQVTGMVDHSRYVPVMDSLDSSLENGGFRKYISTQAEAPDQYVTDEQIRNKEECVKTNVDSAKVNVPFATHLFSQECKAMGIGMRLMPEGAYPLQLEK